MEMEHCSKAGCKDSFTSGNYCITTCPYNEWRISVDSVTELADMTHGRQLKKISDLIQSEAAKEAKLVTCEVIAVVLYTGPMVIHIVFFRCHRQLISLLFQFVVYNAILRRFPKDLYSRFFDGGNLYATTIHVLVSAVQKISRVTKLLEGMKLYRGLGGMMELPDHFFKGDKFGCRGFAEWGFMSSTTSRDVALQYSGVKEGRPRAMVLVISVGAVDRGACIRDFSQFPGEKEYLYLPVSFLAPLGPIEYEITDHGLVQMIPVRVNSNLKALTTEQMLERKKQMHISSFKHLLDDLHVKLAAAADSDVSQSRLANDLVNSAGARIKAKVQDLVEKILEESRKVLSTHEALRSEDFVEILAFRARTQEMMDTVSFARAKFEYWVSSAAEKIESVISYSPRMCHRLWTAKLERRVLTCTGPEQQAEALALCRIRGLVESSVEECNEVGETPLQLAAAEGMGLKDLRLLVLASADVDGLASDGRTPAYIAAQSGQDDSLRALVALGASVNRAGVQGRSPMWIAALNGHVDCIRALRDLGGDVDQAADNSCTPLYVAAECGHVECVSLLQGLGADPNRQERNGMTPAFIAALNGHAAVLSVLSRVSADLDRAKPNGCTPAYVAAEFGHAECLRVLAGAGADMGRANVNGVTPAEVARRRGHESCVELLGLLSGGG
jgi:ankyrin repeat protein